MKTSRPLPAGRGRRDPASTASWLHPDAQRRRRPGRPAAGCGRVQVARGRRARPRPTSIGAVRWRCDVQADRRSRTGRPRCRARPSAASARWSSWTGSAVNRAKVAQAARTKAAQRAASSPCPTTSPTTTVVLPDRAVDDEEEVAGEEPVGGGERRRDAEVGPDGDLGRRERRPERLELGERSCCWAAGRAGSAPARAGAARVTRTATPKKHQAPVERGQPQDPAGELRVTGASSSSARKSRVATLAVTRPPRQLEPVDAEHDRARGAYSEMARLGVDRRCQQRPQGDEEDSRTSTRSRRPVSRRRRGWPRAVGARAPRPPARHGPNLQRRGSEPGSPASRPDHAYADAGVTSVPELSAFVTWGTGR